MANDARPQVTKEQLMQIVLSDRLLEAVNLAKDLPEGDPARTEIEALAAYTRSPEDYQKHYRETMQGGECPERDLFTRHLLVKRFAGIRDRILARKQMRVLDLGCLDGWCLLNLAAGGVTGVGVDLNPQALEIARERTRKYGFDLLFIQSAIEDFNAEVALGIGRVAGKSVAEFDAVLLSEVLEHVLDPVACFKVAFRHLAPGGMVYVSTPSTAIPHHGKVEDAALHLRVFSEGDLRNAARQAGLAETVDCETIEQEDRGQRFGQRFMAFRRVTAAIYTNHVTGGWDPTDRASLNASEEAVVQVAEQWAQDGHDVMVYQNGALIHNLNTLPAFVDEEPRQLSHAGVTYRPREAVLPDNLDYLVLFKTTERHEHSARVKVFWTTDLPGPGAGAGFLPPIVAERLDRVVCISEWHRRQVLEACPWIPPEKITAHWVGVDQKEIRAARAAVPEPVPKRAVYASSLDRGAVDLLRMWPRVRERVPGAELRVLYGLDFWKRSEAVLQEPVRSQMQQQRLELERLLAQPGVLFGRAPSREEYMRELASASVWAYPCTGGELCCKVALEAQELGVVPVVIPTMALSETVLYGLRAENLEAFEDALVQLLGDNELRSDILNKAMASARLEPDRMRIPTWADLAAHLWRPVAANLDGATVSAPVPAEVRSQAKPLPERFAVPAPSAAMPTVGLDIIFQVNGMAFDGNTDKERSLGGSETMSLQLARALARRGHHMTVFSNCDKPGKYDGVAYLPLGEFPRYIGSTSCDVCVVQRDPGQFNMPMTSKLNILWMHDLALLRYIGRVRASLWNVDYVVPVSHWHGRQLCEVYGLDPATIAPMRNGIEASWVQGRQASQGRDRRALVYASRPERGLDLLLERVFPRLLERDPRLTLHIAAYDNTVPEMKHFYDYCNSLCDGYGDRVKRMGAMRKPDLYAFYRRAGAYIYCTKNFEEVSCLSLMESVAAGMPFVGSAWGALPETASYCPDAVRLVPHPGSPTEAYIQDFVEAVWSVVSDPEVHKRMSQAGYSGGKAYDWERIAAEWEAFLLGALELRSRDKARLVKHFWRIGDVYGAEQARDELPPGETIGGLDTLVIETPDRPPMDVPPSVLNAIANTANHFRAKTIRPLCTETEMVARQVAPLIGGQVVLDGPASLVLGVETLDCAADPAAHVGAAEALAAPGGAVCLVTAGSAVQQHRIHSGQPRAARWVYDQHDVRDLLGRKRDLLAMVVGGGVASAYDGMPLAWNLYAWRAGSGPTGEIGKRRRLAVQSPRLSLTCMMITRNAEGMLHRCLGSVAPYVDEMVICDQQSTDSTRAILAQYGAKIVEGLDPTVRGFDETRNIGLSHVTGDLILWIDSDEELLEGASVPKYLRWNMYNGYALRQHHFSAVPENAFKPDLPVRIFRRLHVDGAPTDIKWFGVVHEHPEIRVNESVGESICLSDVHIAHMGYLTENVRRRRFDRNIALMFRDRAKHPHRILGKLLMIRDWVHLGRYSAQQAGGQMTPEAAAYYDNAIREYQAEFLGKAHTMAVDGLAYYNEALQVLGRGFDVDVTLKVVGADGGAREISYRGRVASPDDFLKLISGTGEEIASCWRGKYI